MNEKDWVTRLKTTLKNLVNVDYEKVEAKTLWGIRLVILVKPEHAMKITHLQNSQVRTGIGNALGNKGAVGLSFYFGNLSLCFISGHLTSGTEKCHRLVTVKMVFINELFVLSNVGVIRTIMIY